MTKTWRTALLLGGLVAAVVLIVVLTHRSRSRTNLAKYKAQLRARGEKLTFIELTQSRSTQSNNGIQLLTNAARKLNWSGISPGSLEPRTFVGPGLAVAAWEMPLPTSAMSGAQANWENFSAQLETNGLVLNDIRKILSDPPLDSGFRTNMFFQPVNNFVALRTAAQWLSADACCELHLGHREKALDDLVAIAGLSRMNAGEFTLISQMIRVAITGLGIAVTWDALQSQGWTEAELLKLQNAWNATDLRDGLERAFLGERANANDFFNASQAFARTRLLMGSPRRTSLSDFAADHIAWPAYKMTVAADDELLHLTSMQTTIDGLRSLETTGSWNQTAIKLNGIAANISKISASPQGFMYWFSTIAIPNTVKAVNTGIRAETDRQLLVAAIAIKRFAIRNGHPPPALNNLVPEFLDKLPHDFMSGGPLLYRVKGEEFILYSVGEDGQDDGGNAKSLGVSQFGLWVGKDAVWPLHSQVGESPNKTSPVK